MRGSRSCGHRGRRNFGPLLGKLAQVRRRIQTPPAALRPTQTGSILVAVIEVVVVGQFFSSRNIALRDDPHLAPNLISLAVWLTGMIDERGHPVAINDALAAIQPE